MSWWLITRIALKLKEVDGIKKMTSTSREGGSTIVLQLDPDQTTAEDAKQDVQEVLDAYTDLPDGAEDPIVTIVESKLQPVIELALTGEFEEAELRKTAKFLEREIELLNEVARVDFNGLRDYEIKVEADTEKLKEYRVSLQEIVAALAGRNEIQHALPWRLIPNRCPDVAKLSLGLVGPF